MKSTTLLIAAITLSLSASAALAAPKAAKPKADLDACASAALAKRPGTIVKLERKDEKGVPIYEFDIRGADGKEWDLECDAKQGKVTEEEEEVVDGNAAAFKAKAKVSLEQAKKTALQAYPGEIVETEYEIESNGDASYEFDIKSASGAEVKLEVDAASGKIVEDKQTEIYQIGQE